MPFYQVTFEPPEDYSDIDSIVGLTLAMTSQEAVEVVRYCLEAEEEQPLVLQGVKTIDEAEFLAWMPCSVHSDVRS